VRTKREPEPDMTDPDNPEIPSEAFDRAVRVDDFASVTAALDEAQRRYQGQRGPQRAPTKEITTVRLDAPILAYYRATGRGWQTRMNTDLAQIVARAHAPRPARKPAVVARRPSIRARTRS